MSTNKLSGRLQEIHASGDCGKCLSGLAEMAAALESQRDALKAELAHMIKLKDELCTELEEARKQEPVGVIARADYQTIDALLDPETPLRMAVNETYPRSIQGLPEGSRLYAKPVPAQSSPVAISKTETTTPAVAVPDGWKLVPIDPTTEMLDTDEIVGGSCHSCTPWTASYDDARRIYGAMLSAAPTPPGYNRDSDEVFGKRLSVYPDATPPKVPPCDTE